ncbi:hypothetical protein B0T22DRAFT_69931 [Podospora appendiculata]|uniref:Rhodopsin domain-containing protein n=1 Tax=Podospora appendiculata TaxID=314037 RepID=A0AAE1CH55_9PEZI|nr:hypothetical protein B0T22DRAFT_69931 [Podospora appendiculata]
MATANSTVFGNYTSTENYTLPANTTIWGPIPNDTRRSLQPDIIACSILTWLIAVTFVALRFYTRGKLNHVLGWSDWSILPSLLFAAGVVASSIEQAARGAGKHSWQVDVYGVPALERAAWYGILFYPLSLTFARLSILLLYKRIFTYTWAKNTIQVAITLVTAMGIWFTASVLTACVPLEAFWNWSLFWVTPVYCQPATIWWGNAALHIVSDLVIMTIPLPILSQLNLPRRQKYALVGVFGLGFFVCIVSVLRLLALISVTKETPIDSTYNSAQLIYWTTVEVNAAIVCACIMTLKPLIQKLFPRLLPSNQHARARSLQWITPLGDSTSRLSFVHARPQRASDHSGMSICGSKGSSMPRAEQSEGHIALHLVDLEAQRGDSPSTAVREDEALGTGGQLRAPPRAHLRLSTEMAKPVVSTQLSENPATDITDAKKPAESKIRTPGQAPRACTCTCGHGQMEKTEGVSKE